MSADAPSGQLRLVDLPAPAQDLARAAVAWGDEWWDPEVGLLWNPDDGFEELPVGRSVHCIPQSAWYAYGLLLRDGDGDRARALRTFEALLPTQYDEPGTVWHGTFARFLEWPRPTEGAIEWFDYDPNWREFLGTTFALALADHEDAIPAELTDALVASIDLAVRGEPPGRIAPWYSNIALMKAWLDVTHGTRTGRPELVAAGEAFAADVVELFERHGAFAEYNSPTYYGIDLYALRLWRTRSTSSPPLREWGARIEAALWDDVARFHHAELRNLAGPWSRSYGMDMTAYLGGLGLFTWSALGRELAAIPDLDAPFAHSHDLFKGACVAALGVDMTPAAEAAHRGFTGPRLVCRQITSEPDRVATAWLESGLAVGAEGGGGISAWGQFHPAVVQWLAPDGSVAWLRLRHRAPVAAEAGERRLTVRCEPHPVHGPQPTSIEVRAPGLTPAAMAGDRWELPGLTIGVEADAEVASVDQTAADLVVVRYEPQPGPAVWAATVTPATSEPADPPP